MSKISAKTGKFLFNYSCLFWGPLFIETHCRFWSTVLLLLLTVKVTYNVQQVCVPYWLLCVLKFINMSVEMFSAVFELQTLTL